MRDLYDRRIDKESARGALARKGQSCAFSRQLVIGKASQGPIHCGGTSCKADGSIRSTNRSAGKWRVNDADQCADADADIAMTPSPHI
jgi:hypothetical protein